MAVGGEVSKEREKGLYHSYGERERFISWLPVLVLSSFSGTLRMDDQHSHLLFECCMIMNTLVQSFELSKFNIFRCALNKI